jgi:hypothetical protein
MDPIKKKFTDPKSVMFSNAWWSNLHKNWWQIFLKLALTLLVFWLIWMAITPLINFNSYFKWFRKGGGEKYKNCFRFSQLAYAHYFPLYFYIGQLIHSENIDSHYQSQMLLWLIATYSDQLGLGQPLTPKALCESIIPDGVMSDETRTAYNKIDTKDQLTTREWPPAEAKAQWQRIFFVWGAGGVPSNCNNQTSPTSTPDIKWPTCSPVNKGGNPMGAVGDFNCWSKAPDNFLWQQWAIPPQSPMIISYQTGFANFCNTPIKPDQYTLAYLLGDRRQGGKGYGQYGWWGAIKNMYEPNRNYDDLRTAIWGSVDLPGVGGSNNNPAPKCGEAGILGAVNAGIGGAATGAFTAHAFGAFKTAKKVATAAKTAATAAGEIAEDVAAAGGPEDPVGWVIGGVMAIVGMGGAATASSLATSGCI